MGYVHSYLECRDSRQRGQPAMARQCGGCADEHRAWPSFHARIVQAKLPGIDIKDGAAGERIRKVDNSKVRDRLSVAGSMFLVSGGTGCVTPCHRVLKRFMPWLCF